MEFSKAVIFTLGNEGFWFDISQIERILENQDITYVTDVQHYILGVKVIGIWGRNTHLSVGNLVTEVTLTTKPQPL